MPTQPHDILAQPLALPCGATLPNRLCKAAMTEGLADPHNWSTAKLDRLYRLWSEGGAGLLLTGNVQIDRKHMEAGGNVAIAGKQPPEALAALKSFAAAGTVAGNHLWMQISHAGRQTPKAINPTPKAPSAHMVNLPGGRFGQPVAMTAADIADVIAGFVNTAVVARETGFTGVQIHAAHGYLVSSFLSPKANTRTDEWGGDLGGRARLLLDIVRQTRAAVGADFPISVKINSADFQRGGFSFDDSQTVVRWLDAEGVDLIEISGGSYEQPSMMNMDGAERAYDPTVTASTRARESYFQKFAPEIRKNLTRAKLMVTGGFRTTAGMASAITHDGVDMVGLARPLCADVNAAQKLLAGTITELDRWESNLRIGPGWLGPASPIMLIKAANGFGIQSWFCEQLRAQAATGAPNLKLGVFGALMASEKHEKIAIGNLVA